MHAALATNGSPPPLRLVHSASDFQFSVEENPLLGTLLDRRYRVTGLIAKGGTSRIYRAEQVALRRTVALKVLTDRSVVGEQLELRERFLREFGACARLSHPNIVKVYDYGGLASDQMYMAMELLEGPTLQGVLRREGPLSPDRFMSIARQLGAALDHAHQAGLVHRDVKPSNVMLVQEVEGERVKLLDFGLVRDLEGDSVLTGGGGPIGSPSFMSPEQVRTEATDARSDIYSMGCLLYACIAGRPPFVWSSAMGVLWGHISEAPPALPADSAVLSRYPEVAGIVMRCLAKSPDERYPSVDALLHALCCCELGISQGPRTLPAARTVLREAPAEFEALPSEPILPRQVPPEAPVVVDESSELRWDAVVLPECPPVADFAWAPPPAPENIGQTIVPRSSGRVKPIVVRQVVLRAPTPAHTPARPTLLTKNMLVAGALLLSFAIAASFGTVVALAAGSALLAEARPPAPAVIHLSPADQARAREQRLAGRISRMHAEASLLGPANVPQPVAEMTR